MTNHEKNVSTWTCPTCGKGNPAQGRFCGQCGYFRAPQSQPRLELMVHARKTAIYLGQRFIKREWLMALCVLLVLGFSPILALQITGPKSFLPKAPQKVSWGAFRTHLSRALGLTLTDVDKLLIFTLKTVPPESSTVRCEQAQTIKNRLGELPELNKPVFHWLPQKGDLLVNYLTIPKAPGAVFHFADVPGDHPVYPAWKALLDLGAPLGSNGKTSEKILKARPYDPICHDEWQGVLAFLQMNGEKKESDIQASHSSKDLLSFDQWRKSLDQVTDFLGMEKIKPYEKTPKSGRLSRLTAFSVLSEIVSQSSETK